MSQTLLQQPRKAPPVGRVLRILLGLVLMGYMAPVYFQVPVRVAVGSLLLMLGFIGVYSLIHIVVSRRIVPLWPMPRGHCGYGVTRRAVCCRCLRATDSWPRKG